LFYFDCETSTFPCLNYYPIPSWNQPVLSNEGKLYMLKNPTEPLIGLELTTDRHQPNTS